ncbi:MAG TPA: GNAT family N-acetyltransferase [Solirubrobacteraceae bacterium]|nr:GNAT family N-acetyltransferase [Solirubrobacteraceae bacterium]
MNGLRLDTERLALLPLDPAAAAALPDGRISAAQVIGAELSADWPGRDLLDVLPMQASLAPVQAHYGVWVVLERATNTVVGDIGFFGPPDSDGTLQVGYSIVLDRRRRGYATEAARALVGWALEQPNVRTIVAGCDEDNQPSIRTLERVGFSRTGRVERQLRWRYQ